MCEKDSVGYGELSVGIDIGTTTISAAVIDIISKKQIDVYTVNYDASISSPEFSEQSVDVITEKSEGLLKDIFDGYKNIISIGITGQMHGILYVNEMGIALSNLINWQDKRADKPVFSEKSACEEIERITGEKIATGYGIATHYYNLQKDLVPKDATAFCSIMDYFAMRLCNLKKPITHSTIAASFGLFDLEINTFKNDKCALLGIDQDFLPCVTSESKTVGKWNGIPVCVGIGDNQASFLGAVKENKKCILVNIGTGSQTSVVCDDITPDGDVEIRPFIEKKYLACGSALCGGASYSLLEKFFREYAIAAGMDNVSQYKIINDLALQAYNEEVKTPMVDTAFGGTRKDPHHRGSVFEIDMNNFTPGALILGFIKGMSLELYKLCKGYCDGKEYIVASGGAVRKNIVLKNVIGDTFKKNVSVSQIKEEAATGAALFAAFSVGKINYNDGFSEFIDYGE